MDILDNLWQAWGDPYGKMGVISVGSVDVFCCIIIVDMYYFMFIDIDVYVNSVIECNNVWLRKDVCRKVRFIGVGREGVVFRVVLVVIVVIIKGLVRGVTELFKCR